MTPAGSSLTLSVVLIVASNLLYHVAQKSIPRTRIPLLSVAVTYAAALLLTLLLWPFSPGGAPKLVGLAKLNWATIGVAVSAVGIEIGFLLAYRAGWNISVGSLVVSVAVAILLLPTGLLLYREHLSAANVTGIVLCLAGLVLVMLVGGIP
jgi:drug/metabolite transporter (DMT)-like permease